MAANLVKNRVPVDAELLTIADKGRAGIYCIVNIVNGKTYVGQSVDLYERKKGHLYTLRRGLHGNPYLQHSFNRYSESSFKFVVLRYCKIVLLNYYEQYWIERIEPDYNIVRNIFEPHISRERPPLDPNHIYKEDEFERPEWHKYVYGGCRDRN